MGFSLVWWQVIQLQYFILVSASSDYSWYQLSDVGSLRSWLWDGEAKSCAWCLLGRALRSPTRGRERKEVELGRGRRQAGTWLPKGSWSDPVGLSQLASFVTFHPWVWALRKRGCGLGQGGSFQLRHLGIWDGGASSSWETRCSHGSWQHPLCLLLPSQTTWPPIPAESWGLNFSDR